MKKILLIIAILSIACFAQAQAYRIVCPSCSTTNLFTTKPATQNTSQNLPDTAKEVNRKLITSTATFTCQSCSNGIVTISRRVSSQRIVDVKADAIATETYISTHPVTPPIKIK